MENRSPSPNPSRQHSSNTRTPESTCGGARKVYGLFTPTPPSKHPIQGNNNPSELSHRASKGKTGGGSALRSSLEQKENEVKSVRSSAAAGGLSKGTKNFMAPTISASSKVISPSPNRRILSERNETVLPHLDEGSMIRLSLTDLMRVRSSLPSIPHSVAQVSAPPDADLSLALPSYDPETNYLSPRPRFLHYKPKPRVEPGYGKHLGHTFSSDRCEGDTQSSSSQNSLEKEKEDDETISPFLKAGEISNGNHHSLASSAHSSGSQRSSYFFLKKFVSFVVILALVCLSFPVTYNPIVSPPLLSNLDVPALSAHRDPNTRASFPKAANFVDQRLKGFAYLLQHWSVDVLARSPQLISSLREEDIPLSLLGSWKTLATDGRMDDSTSQAAERSSLETDMETLRETCTARPELGTMVEEIIPVADDSGYLEHQLPGIIDVADEGPQAETAHVQVSGISDMNLEDIQNGSRLEIQAFVTEDVTDVKLQADSGHDQITTETEEVISDLESDLHVQSCSDGEMAIESMNDDIEAPGNKNLDLISEVQQTNTEDSNALSVSEEKLQLQTILAISSVVALAAVLLSFFLRKKQPPLSQEGHGPSVASSGALQNIRHSRQQITRKSSNDEDIMSRERNPRRDSTASSSSFGSFTTYENLSAKKGRKDEALTPVRRSSRIRSQLTS